MSQPTTYEQLIAQKLQELAVPDQADAIWATIEHQLNIEMPNNSSGSGGLNNSNWWIGGGLLTLFIAIIIYIFISKQNPEREKDLEHEPPVIRHEQPLKNKETTPDHTTPPIKVNASKPVVVSEKITSEIREPEQLPAHETLKNEPVQKVTEEPLALPRPADTVITRKKPRGVKGISDADYRLVPSRAFRGDSTN
ncbi:MAG TPA: hypothetical protein VGE58_10645 [Daejeonella sp.]